MVHIPVLLSQCASNDSTVLGASTVHAIYVWIALFVLIPWEVGATHGSPLKKRFFKNLLRPPLKNGFSKIVLKHIFLTNDHLKNGKFLKFAYPLQNNRFLCHAHCENIQSAWTTKINFIYKLLTKHTKQGIPYYNLCMKLDVYIFPMGNGHTPQSSDNTMTSGRTSMSEPPPHRCTPKTIVRPKRICWNLAGIRNSCA